LIIVSTRPDGGVSLTCPSAEIMSWLTLGGAPEGYFGRINWDAQIEEMTSRGVYQDVAARYVRGVQSGGFTDAEAYELIRDRDTKPEWTGKELWDEVPTDRWFRNAWRRSPNGGPIYIDLERARPVQFWRIRSAIREENKKREYDIDLFDVPLEYDLAEIRERIRQAPDDATLRHIWPRGLPIAS
jgi:hypothetical protein